MVAVEGGDLGGWEENGAWLVSGGFSGGWERESP